MSEGIETRGRWFAFSLRMLLVVFVLGGISLSLEPILADLFLGSNCGGNSAALAGCSYYAGVVRWWAEKNPGTAFSYDQLDEETNLDLRKMSGEPWIRARFLMNLDILHPGARQIVVVCDHAYDNVPQRLLWRASMTHAVGYSTGDTGLISQSEFAALDLADFVDLRAESAKISE